MLRSHFRKVPITWRLLFTSYLPKKSYLPFERRGFEHAEVLSHRKTLLAIGRSRIKRESIVTLNLQHPYAELKQTTEKNTTLQFSPLSRP